MDGYEGVSPQPYPEDLKISTLLSGLPTDMRLYLQMQVSDSTTYQSLRDKVLQFERSSSTWTSDQMLKTLGIDKLLGCQDSSAMDVDRVEWKGRGGKKGEGKGGKKGYPKGKKGDYAGGKKGDAKGKKGDGKQGKKGDGKAWSKNFEGQGKYDQQQKLQKGSGACLICGKTGHLAAECSQRAQQVQAPVEEAPTNVPSSAASSTSTTSTLPSSASRRVNRVFEVDLRSVAEGDDDVLGFSALVLRTAATMVRARS